MDVPVKNVKFMGVARKDFKDKKTGEDKHFFLATLTGQNIDDSFEEFTISEKIDFSAFKRFADVDVVFDLCKAYNSNDKRVSIVAMSPSGLLK